MEHSFVVRLYQETGTTGPVAGWIGIVEEPVSGERKAFRDAKELWTFLTEYLRPSRSSVRET